MQESAPDTVWIYESTEEPYACFAGRYTPGYEDFLMDTILLISWMIEGGLLVRDENWLAQD